MKSYTHFTLSERNCLQQFLSEGKGVREIGRLMGRSASSISREIKRNCKDKKRVQCVVGNITLDIQKKEVCKETRHPTGHQTLYLHS